MKTRFFLLALFVLQGVVGCINNNTSSQTQVRESIVDRNNRQDTVYLGYLLGKPIEPLTQRLIAKGKLSRKTTRTYTVSEAGFSVPVKVQGYPVTVYFGSSSYDALLHMETDAGKLYRQEIYIPAYYSSDIVSALKEKYGEKFDKYPSGFTPKLESKVCYFINQSNKAVYLLSCSGFYVLVYEDIIYQEDKRRQEQEAREIVSDYNRQQAKTTQSEL